MNIRLAFLRHRCVCAFVINIYSTQIQQSQMLNIHIVEENNLFRDHDIQNLANCFNVFCSSQYSTD